MSVEVATHEERGGRIDRAAWLLLLLGALSVVVVARALEPSPSGVGTHEQLGLPACGFLAWLGVPCPACGLTTSFAHLADFALLPALRAHPLGLPLFLLTLALIPVSVWGAYTGLSLLGAIERFKVDGAALLFTGAALLVWLLRLLVC